MEVLERIGILVKSDTILNLLNEAGAQVDLKEKNAKIPENLIREGLKKAPSSFILCSRRGKRLKVGGRKTYIASGAGAIWILDLETGERRRAEKRDVEETSKLIDALEGIDISIPLVTPQDVGQRVADVHAAEAMMRNTDKTYFVAPASGQQAQYIIEMAATIVGGIDELEKNPILAGGMSPTSPLTHAANELNIAREFAENKLPLIILPCPMCGASSPVSLAGTLVTMNAENLSLILIAELMNPGTPIAYGTVPSIMDMKTAKPAQGSPEAALMTAAIVQMARHYDIPSYASITITESQIPDIQAGYESTWMALLPMMAGASLCIGPGMLATSLAASYEKLVIDNEILGGVERIMRGIDISELSMAVDVIDAVGPGGHFLTEKHTREMFRTEHWLPRISNRTDWRKWQKKERGLDLWQKARDEAKKILGTHQPEPLDENTEKRIGELLKEAEKELMKSEFYARAKI